jgi:hypothetical protein
MSIRYDRQYKQNVDITGPIGPNTNEQSQNSEFLNNNDVYLNNGGGGGGTYYSAPVNPPKDDLIYTPGLESPIIDVIKPTPENPTPNIDVITDPTIDYELSISSNLQNEIGDFVNINYELISKGLTTSGNLKLSDSNTDNLKSTKSILVNGILNIYLKNTLPSNYNIKKIYYTNKPNAEKNKTDYSKWSMGDSFIGIPAKELLTGGIAVAVILEKVINSPKPNVTLDSTTYDIKIKESDTDGIVNIKFNQTNCDFVDFYIGTDNKIRVEAAKGALTLSLKTDFNGVYGSKKIIAVPLSDLYGTGDKTEIIINFSSTNDFPSITEIIYPNKITIPSFSDYNIQYDIKYTSYSATSIDVYLELNDKTFQKLIGPIVPNGLFSINLKTLKDTIPNWKPELGVLLKLKPINNGGEQALVGNDYEIKTELLLPKVFLNEDLIKKSIFDAFINKLSILEPEKESKYLTHLANFGNDEQILISSWEVDDWTLSKKSKDELGNELVKPDDVVSSTILKLYSPLPANVTNNSTLWITKLMTNPLIETIVLNDQSDLKCPPIKGPNFNIDVDYVKGQSTNFESLDDLIFSTETTSSLNLISTYISSSVVNTNDLNIQYVSGSTYLWNNFVHFSSAKERVLNFDYKNKLIELYDTAIQNAQTASWVNSLSSQQDVERQTIKKNQIIQSFDGFEKYLRDNSVTGSAILNNLAAEADLYDLENPNYILNNIPQYIVNNTNNDNLLLFFTMVGQHFDNIYYHTKAIEKTRGMGYQQTNGISDKLLFNALKSMNWDAKNLATDSKLWEYAFGLDSDGNTKETNPAKQRTYEVWRRIINNLPYLLKHKGTKRGIYAIMSCYGIPSSNLSILEFGGPEIDNDAPKSKLIMDNMTTALVMNSGSYFEMKWENTNKGRKPDTIEFFVKPNTSGNYNVVTGVESSLAISMSGSIGSKYGVVKIGTTTGEYITSSLLPIFNDKFFGIKVSREVSGSYHNFELSVRQSQKERTIFEETKTTSISNTISVWDNGSTLRFGNGFVGSVDEFRLWSEPLNKDIFFDHVSFPEMINGNSVSASTSDLYFRLDFEYPKNLAVSQSLINVDTNIYFEKGLTRNHYEGITTASLYSENTLPMYSASAHGFTPITSYPFNFEVVDRTIVMDYPDGGASRYSTNKVRFESQTMTSDLSSKHRATKKAFDQSPTDSNRVGLFFSPTKELNLDIAKSFGGLNIDNYIGDPSDDYKPNYSELDSLRNYYFQRFDGRDIYSYINLIKLYEKSMFEDIKKMLPARVKATVGLLIEPHFLERSKVAHKKPTGENEQLETDIHYSDTTILQFENEQFDSLVDANLYSTIIGENEQFESLVDANLSKNIIGENEQLDTTIVQNDTTILIAEDYQKNITIDAGLGNPTIQTEIDVMGSNQVIGQSDYEDIGFGLYAQSGSTIRTYINKDGMVVKERIKVSLITKAKTRTYLKPNSILPNGLADIRGEYTKQLQTYYETTLNIQPFTGSNGLPSTPPTASGNIISVQPVDGYLPTHNKFVSDLTTGLKNSYYLGSKYKSFVDNNGNTIWNTIDGAKPVETFVSNPNTLTVNKTGRSTNEPILLVE